MGGKNLATTYVRRTCNSSLSLHFPSNGTWLPDTSWIELSVLPLAHAGDTEIMDDVIQQLCEEELHLQLKRMFVAEVMVSLSPNKCPGSGGACDGAEHAPNSGAEEMFVNTESSFLGDVSKLDHMHWKQQSQGGLLHHITRPSQIPSNEKRQDQTIIERWHPHLTMMQIHSLLTMSAPRVTVPVDQLVEMEVVLVLPVQKALVKEEVGQHIPMMNHMSFIIKLWMLMLRH